MGNKFITKEGKKVSLGEPLSITVTLKKEGVKENFIFRSNKLTSSQARILVMKGMLREDKFPDREAIPMVPTIDEIFALVSTWLMSTPHEKDTAKEFLTAMPDYARFSVMLRALAVLIDRKYPDHINNADVDKYFTIDMTNGRVCEVPKGKIKNFRNFAAFRNIDDIKIATKILRPLIKELWPNE
jgi:hypothetical protein